MFREKWKEARTVFSDTVRRKARSFRVSHVSHLAGLISHYDSPGISHDEYSAVNRSTIIFFFIYQIFPENGVPAFV
jgi:hypothetical protein